MMHAGTLTCRICGNDADNRSFTLREMMFGTRETFAYFECAKCKCIQIAEIPADVGKYYPAGYYSHALRESNGDDESWSIRMLRQLHLAARAGGIGMLDRRLEQRLGPLLLPSWSGSVRLHPLTRVLDVGCGNGAMLLQLGRLGLRKLTGIDPFMSEDRKLGYGIELYKRDVGEMRETFDVIMLHHVFEHVPDPKETLRQCGSLLARNGVIVMRIPTVPCEAWNRYGINWVQLDPPRHFYIHSPDSLLMLADAAGLQITSWWNDSTGFQFWGSEQYERDIPLRSGQSYVEDNSVYSAQQIDSWEKQATVLNEQGIGDQSVVLLRRL
jgi:SAM-dependent methyltransferase